MIKNRLSILALLLATQAALGQEKERKFEISQFLMETGENQLDNSTLSRDDIYQFSSQSKIAKNLYNLGDTMRFQNDYHTSSSPNYQFHLVFTKKGEHVFDQRLKLGLGIYNNSVSSSSFVFQSTGRYDTLTSSQTGAQQFIDTTYTRYINALIETKQTAMQAGYEWHYQAEKRWHWFLAANVAFGFGTSERLVLTEGTHRYNNQQYSQNSQEEFNHEAIKLRSSTMQRIQGQVGLDFRLSKKDNFFGNSFLRCTGSYILMAHQNQFGNTPVQTGFGYTLGYGFKFGDLNARR